VGALRQELGHQCASAGGSGRARDRVWRQSLGWMARPDDTVGRRADSSAI